MLARRRARRTALYLRVSTTGQTVENQRRELRAVAKQHGWEVVKEFTDEGISGANGREKRPGFAGPDAWTGSSHPAGRRRGSWI
jgi:predicted site-specific integrase-resolvase